MNLTYLKLLLIILLFQTPYINAQCFLWYGEQWQTNSVIYHVNSGLGSEFATQTEYETAIQSAVTQWNGAGANFSFVPGNEVNYSFGTEPAGINQIGSIIDATLGKEAFTVVSVSSFSSSNYITKVETYFNQNFVIANNTTSTSAQYDLLSVILHELGHWLSLEDETLFSCSSNVMYYQLSQGEVLNTLTSDDKDGIISIYGDGTTGIEDGLVITEATDHYDINREYIGDISVSFQDRPPTNTITQWGNWQYRAMSTCGSILVYQSQYNDIDIPSLPNGYLWERDANGYVIATVSTSATENDGTILTARAPIKLSNVPNTFVTSGTLATNTNWCGNLIITGTITVPSAITLTVNPGANIQFASGASLIVNGILNANLCTFTSQSGTTAGSWGNINLTGSGASNSIISNVNIQYGSGIQFQNGANSSLQNSTISNCTQGIYIYGASPIVISNQILNPTNEGIYIDGSSSSPQIYSNLIKRTTGQNYEGIYTNNNTTPYISHNQIGGFVYGMYIGGGTVARLQGAIVNSQNNLIYGNNTGLCAGWGSTVYGGYQGNGMYNSIHGNTVDDAYSYQSSHLYAEWVYWGPSPLRYVDATSTLDYTNTLSSDPWNGATPAIKEKDNSQNGELVASLSIPNPIILDSSLTDPFSGLNLEDKGDLSGAITQYMGLIAKDNHADFAITELFKLYKQYSRNDIITYFGNFSSGNKHYPLVSKLIADNNLQTGEFDKAISTYDNLTKSYPNDYYGINARFQKLFAYMNIKHDKPTAQQMLAQIKTLNLTDPMWTIQIQQAESMLGSSGSSNNSGISTPAGYTVVNYPNPFNPSTIIQYQLPANGLVTVKVFDVLGREVRTLVNDYKTQGTYTVSFDASKLASGIYFYQLRAGNFISTKKMLLLK